MDNTRLQRGLHFTRAQVILHPNTRDPAPEPDSCSPQREVGAEAELNGAHTALRKGDKETRSCHWAATDEHKHVAHTAVWKQTARAGIEREEGEICCFTLVIEKLKKMVG